MESERERETGIQRSETRRRRQGSAFCRDWEQGRVKQWYSDTWVQRARQERETERGTLTGRQNERDRVRETGR